MGGTLSVPQEALFLPKGKTKMKFNSNQHQTRVNGNVVRRAKLLFATIVVAILQVSIASADTMEIRTDTTWLTEAGDENAFICPADPGDIPDWADPAYDDTSWVNAVTSESGPIDVNGEIVESIWNPQFVYLSNFRKKFTVTGTVQSAMLYARSDDGAHVFINGVLAASHEDAAGEFSADVASLLVSGENTIAVEVWDGSTEDGHDACDIRARVVRLLAVSMDIETEEEPPEENACINVSNNLLLADFSSITDSNVAVGNYWEMGVGAEITGNVEVDGNAFFRGQPWAPNTIDGDITLSGTLNQQQAVNLITGDFFENTAVTPVIIPTQSHPYGGGWTGKCNETLAPGTYGNVSLNAGCSLTLVSGEYNFDRLYVQPDAELIIDGDNGPVYINAHSEFSFGDRASVDSSALPEDLIVYTNQNYQVHVGGGSDFIGHIIAPNAKVAVFTNADYYGCIYAKDLGLEPHAQITGAPEISL